MEVQVVLVSCKFCIFAQNAESILLSSLDSINRNDVGNISLRVTSYDLRELCHNSVAVTIRKAKVQIVIVTHSFLDELKNAGPQNFYQIHLNRVVHSKGVICILVKIQAQDILRNYTNLLPNFIDWNVLELSPNKKVDKGFLNAFQYHVTQTYNQRAKYNESKIPHPSLWTTIPCPMDTVKPLLLSTCSNEGMEIITIKLNETIGPSDELKIQLKRGNDIFSTVVHIPDNLVPVSGNDSIVKVEAPFQLEGLDNEDLLDKMLKKMPSCKQYLDNHLSETLQQIHSVGAPQECLTFLQEFINGRDDLLPTPLHFAAYYDLSTSCTTMLAKDECLRYLEMTNSENKTPLDIARSRGHEGRVGQILQDYVGLVSTWNVEVKGSQGQVIPSSERIDSVFNSPIEGNNFEIEITTPSEDDHLNPSSTTYNNIEIVPPDLPERKRLPLAVSPDVSGDYIDTLQTPYYAHPPAHRCKVVGAILTRKDGTIPRTAENYIHLFKGQGDTMSRLNRNPIRMLSFNSTSEEDDDIGYNVPLPPIPSEVKKGQECVLDNRDQELVGIMRDAVIRGSSWEEVEFKFKKWKQNPHGLASDERKLKELESLRAEYNEIQKIRTRRDAKESGFLTNVFQRIKNAAKKISNAGVRNSFGRNSGEAQIEAIPLATSPSSSGFTSPPIINPRPVFEVEEVPGTNIEELLRGNRGGHEKRHSVMPPSDIYDKIRKAGRDESNLATQDKVLLEPVGRPTKPQYVNVFDTPPPPLPPKKSLVPMETDEPVITTPDNPPASVEPQSTSPIIPPKPMARNLNFYQIDYNKLEETENKEETP